MNSKEILPLSFAGTCLESSYQPVFMKHKEADSSEDSSYFTTVLGYKVIPLFANIHVSPEIEEIKFSAFSALCEPFWIRLWKTLRNWVSTFTKKKKLNEIKTQFNSFVISTKEGYTKYKEKHEIILKDIILDIDIINRKKTLMKDYLLTKLFQILSKMGIQSTFTDLTVEHIDLRDFPINEGYNVVEQNQIESEKIIDSIWLDISELLLSIYPFGLLLLRFSNNREIKKIEEKYKKLIRLNEYNIVQMNADLARIGKFEMALKNVSQIYADIMDILMPIMEKLLSNLATDCDNDFSNMHSDKIEAIRNIKNILKDLSEVRIIPNKTIDKLMDDVVDYNNKLSEMHYDIKAEMLKLAV